MTGRRYRHGLVIGKFYPLHAGHQHLIDTAARSCDRLTVVPMASRLESVPLATRVGWLRELYAEVPHVRIAGVRDDHPVDYDSEQAWRVHTDLMRTAVARAAILDGNPDRAGVDAVFSSEPYGAQLAARFGAAAVLVDVGRDAVPVSGTAVRADPAGAWHHLSPPVRRTLARRVVVVGAESTGTTTLAGDLQGALIARGGSWELTRCVPEIGRRWTYDLLAATAAHRVRTGQPAPTMADLLWVEEDFEAIATAQRAAEDDAAAAGGPVLVCDTDAFATDLWFGRYLGGSSAGVLAVAAVAPLPALYLLTDHDGVPFEQDGIRDGEHLRAGMTAEFRRRLVHRGLAVGAPVVELWGDRSRRLGRALAAVDEVVAGGWGLTGPPG
ncbi:MAG: transcriptional regulator [Frankiales bacterium]|nr:transcriptional regulator [Frankiales bacterium]